MPIEALELEQLIRNGFPDAEIEVCDLAGDKDHYQVTVASSAFAGKSRVIQHKMVFEAVKGYNIHALSVVTKAK